MINYANLRPGAGFQADRALLYYSQRAITEPLARRAISSVIAAGVRRRQGGALTGDLQAEHKDVLATLRRDGVSMMPPLLSDAALGEFVDYFLPRPVVGPGGAPTPVDQLPAGTPAAPYSLETILGAPGILSLLNDDSVLKIVSEYLGCKPTLSSLGVRWSFPSKDQITDTQRFHRDVDDWRFLKVFVYLTDVDEASGPHMYVRASHNGKIGLKAKSYQRQEVEDRFGRERISTVTGPRGTTFMADTLGVHCGAMPIERPRLIFQAQYSLLPIFAFDYPSPVQTDERFLDPYCNRLFLRPS